MVVKRNAAYIIPWRTVELRTEDLRDNPNLTWRDIVYAAMYNLGGKANLKELYNEIECHIKTKKNFFWKEKIRQVLQKYEDFASHGEGVWSLAG